MDARKQRGGQQGAPPALPTLSTPAGRMAAAPTAGGGSGGGVVLDKPLWENFASKRHQVHQITALQQVLARRGVPWQHQAASPWARGKAHREWPLDCLPAASRTGPSQGFHRGSLIEYSLQLNQHPFNATCWGATAWTLPVVRQGWRWA